jgi:hypothetical protein
VTRGAAAAAAAALVLLAAPAALATPADPPANIPLRGLPAACATAGGGAACERAAIRGLDRAHARLGLPAYRLPPGFVAMPPAHQLLILTDLDRRAYGLTPVPGLATALNRVARSGAAQHGDPNPMPLLESLHGQSIIGFGSDWAGGQPNALVAYYGWMYDDGYGSPNLDCMTPTAAGCWGHRHNILGFAHAPVLTMGASALTTSASYALTIVETSTAPWPYSYRWR